MPVIRYIAFLFLMLITAVHAETITSKMVVSTYGIKKASQSTIDSVIKKNKSIATSEIKFHLEQDFDWKIHEGDLRIKANFLNTHALIVTGNLHIDGSYDDNQDGVGMLVILGNMQVENLLSYGTLHVSGSIMASGVIYTYAPNFIFSANSVSARAFYAADHSTHVSSYKVDYHIDGNDFKIIPTWEKQKTAAFEILSSDAFDYSEIWYAWDHDGGFDKFDVSDSSIRSAIQKDIPIFRSQRAAGLAIDVKALFDPSTKLAVIKKLMGKDLLLTRIAATHPNLSNALMTELAGVNDIQAKTLLASRQDLPGKAVKTLVADSSLEVRSALERNPQISKKILKRSTSK